MKAVPTKHYEAPTRPKEEVQQGNTEEMDMMAMMGFGGFGQNKEKEKKDEKKRFISPLSSGLGF